MHTLYFLHTPCTSPHTSLCACAPPTQDLSPEDIENMIKDMQQGGQGTPQDMDLNIELEQQQGGQGQGQESDQKQYVW